MQGPRCHRPAENQATGAILVLRIIFNHFSVGEDLSHFMDTDPANDGLVHRVFRELELAGLNLLPYLVEKRHACLTICIALSRPALARLGSKAVQSPGSLFGRRRAPPTVRSLALGRWRSAASAMACRTREERRRRRRAGRPFRGAATGSHTPGRDQSASSAISDRSEANG